MQTQTSENPTGNTLKCSGAEGIAQNTTQNTAQNTVDNTARNSARSIAQSTVQPNVQPDSQLRMGMDLRLASEQPDSSYLIDAFMAQYRELTRFAAVQNTPLALTHGSREWDAEVRYANAEKKLGRWAWRPQWESQFAEQSRLEIWQQFAPVDKIRAASNTFNVITVLPATEKVPMRGQVPPQTQMVAPSQLDRSELISLFRLPPDQVHAAVPVVRPFVLQSPVRDPYASESYSDGWLLFLVGKRRDVPRVDKWIQIISGRFPRMARKLVVLETDTESLKEENWIKLLQQSKMCFYFSQSKFDWAVPAFESMYCRVPTVFLDNCHAISELLPKFPLSLPRFLVDAPEGEALQECADEAFSVLKDAGVFESTRLAELLTGIYQSRGKRSLDV
jgi:hypothetical protein